MINCPTINGHFGICRIYGHELGHGILDLVEEVQDQQAKGEIRTYPDIPRQIRRNTEMSEIPDKFGHILVNGPLITQ